jgi:competence protein ComEA
MKLYQTLKQLLSAICLLASLSVTLPATAETSDTTVNADTTATEEIVLFVNINHDSAEKMSDLLNGIGTKKAQAIVEYREANGPFSSADELANVPGIGPATVEKNRDAIVVSEL